MAFPTDNELMNYEGVEGAMLYEDGVEMSFDNTRPLKGDLLYFLPNYYKKRLSTWDDLAKAFYATTEGWSDDLIDFRNGYFFHKATAEQLEYLEIMLIVPVDNSLSNDYRAGRLRAKLSPKSTTRQVVISIAKQFYPNETNPVISEVEADYTLTIFFNNMKVLPIDIYVFKNTIIDIIQADLNFEVVLDVAMSAFTHDELKLQQHKSLKAYRQSA